MSFSILALALALAENPQVPNETQEILLAAIDEPSAPPTIQEVGPPDDVDDPLPEIPQGDISYSQSQGQGTWSESWSKNTTNWYKSSYSQAGWSDSWDQAYGGDLPAPSERPTPELVELELSSEEESYLRTEGLL